jgi:DNA/RNA endonuclease YhcR with UshA esterase domain
MATNRSLTHRLGARVAAVAACALFSIAGATAPSQDAPRTPATTPVATTNPRINWLTIKQALAVPDKTPVFVRATLMSVAEPRPDSRQPWSLYLVDNTGTIRVVIFQDVYRRIADPSFLRQGTRVDVYAVAGEYRGERQLTIEAPTHIRRTPGAGTSALFAGMADESQGSPRYDPVSIGALTMLSIGQTVTISGVVAAVQPSDNERLPTRVMLQDSTGRMPIVYWKPVADRLPESVRPIVGQPLTASGVVTEFQGSLQLRVDDANLVSRRMPVATAADSQTGTTQ